MKNAKEANVMLELVIGWTFLTLVAIMYIGNKVIETIQIRRHCKNKMTKIERR